MNRVNLTKPGCQPDFSRKRLNIATFWAQAFAGKIAVIESSDNGPIFLESSLPARENPYNAKQKVILGHAGLQNMQFLELIFCTC
jgi:hypothetical protein